MKVNVLILSGGTGSRFESNIPKQYHLTNGKSILEFTLERFNSHPLIKSIVIVSHKDWTNYIKDLDLIKEYKKLDANILVGGETRRESSYIGLRYLRENYEDDLVLIHDAVRPFVSHETINNVIDGLRTHDAVYPGMPAIDTVLEYNDQYEVSAIPNRNYLMRGQTPQGFNIDKVLEAHVCAKKEVGVDKVTTNDCSLILRYEICSIKVVKGNYENIKITYPEDIQIYKAFFER